MDGYPPNMLDMVPKERDWCSKTYGCGASSEEKKLELTLGPPGENWSSFKHHHQHSKNTCKEAHDSLLSLGHGTISDHSGSVSTKPWPSPAKFLQFPSNAAAAQGLPVVGNESLQTRNKDAAAVKKGFSPSVATNTAVPYTSQKRTAPAPVVGWPPIRSFRKNLASSSTKPSSPKSQDDNKVTTHGKMATEATPANPLKGLFVKINMDGIPIGRKIDLNAYDSYEKLSSAVDKLFRGLLAAQADSFANGIACKLDEEKPITGLLDGSGEYTLVYEDNEGDRVLVGDVPWSMFVSTVKRLRVLKTSELRSLSLGSKQQKTQLDSPR